MTKQAQMLIVRCPTCQITIEQVTAETMVYCIICRKWCREIEGQPIAATAPVAPRKPRRRFRCH